MADSSGFSSRATSMRTLSRMGMTFVGKLTSCEYSVLVVGKARRVAAVQIQAGLSVRDELRDFADVRRGFTHFLVRLVVEQELAIDGHDLCDNNVRASARSEFETGS